MSDFHEMVSSMRERKERAWHIKNPDYNVDNGGRRLGFERRQFSYSHHYPERRVGNERRSLPERRNEA